MRRGAESSGGHSKTVNELRSNDRNGRVNNMGISESDYMAMQSRMEAGRKSRQVRLQRVETCGPVPVAKPGSKLEERFLSLWQAVQGPPLEREFRFYPARKWRGDFVHVASRTIYELDGMVWNGGHTRGDGYTRDRQRDFEAHCVGWTVVRLVEPLLTKENILALAMRAHVSSPVKSVLPQSRGGAEKE